MPPVRTNVEEQLGLEQASGGDDQGRPRPRRATVSHIAEACRVVAVQLL